MQNTQTRIVDLAEKMMRSSGYNGFSFREIAAEIGIKSSSVHHHFPTKEALAKEVASRYTTNFLAAVGDAVRPNASTKSQIERYCRVYKASFNQAGSGCLCGVLSNEHHLIPSSVADLVEHFIDSNVAWLEQAFAIDGETDAALLRGKSSAFFCSLQGAMGVAALKQDAAWLDTVTTAMCKMALDPE